MPGVAISHQYWTNSRIRTAFSQSRGWSQTFSIPPSVSPVDGLKLSVSQLLLEALFPCHSVNSKRTFWFEKSKIWASSRVIFMSIEQKANTSYITKSALYMARMTYHCVCTVLQAAAYTTSPACLESPPPRKVTMIARAAEGTRASATNNNHTMTIVIEQVHCTAGPPLQRPCIHR